MVKFVKSIKMFFSNEIRADSKKIILAKKMILQSKRFTSFKKVFYNQHVSAIKSGRTQIKTFGRILPFKKCFPNNHISEESRPTGLMENENFISERPVYIQICTGRLSKMFPNINQILRFRKTL